MSFLKQVATLDNGTAFAKPWHGVTATRLHPTTEPTGAAYVAWKAKNYSATLQASAVATTQTGYRCKYNFGQMWKYFKILKRESKTNKTRMAL